MSNSVYFRLWSAAIAFLISSELIRVSGGTVTLITHGFDSDANSWVASMAQAIDNYPRKTSQYGVGDAIYRLFFNSAGYLQQKRISINSPVDSKSGNIILMLDWNPFSGHPLKDDAVSTRNVAPVVGYSLLDPKFIPELNGYSLSQFPLHLIGHSRGGSLVCEISKYLGQYGVVVDHLTLLDPHPINNDGFTLDGWVSGPAVDGTVQNGIYENVSFAEDLWETNTDLLVPNGTPANGAFNRYIGGFQPVTIDPKNTPIYGYGSAHSNVHLWYHGTISEVYPITTDGSANINSDVRKYWYLPQDMNGRMAGYYYSTVASGIRTDFRGPVNKSSTTPASGLNNIWSDWFLIAGTPKNRTPIAEVKGLIPSFVGADLLEADKISITNTTFAVPITYAVTSAEHNSLSAQIACSLISGSATVSAFVDDDENPINGYSDGIPASTVVSSGANRLAIATLDLSGFSKSLTPGFYHVGLKIANNQGSRIMYTSEQLVILPDLSFTWKESVNTPQSAFDVVVKGVRGKQYVIQGSNNLRDWDSIVSGTLTQSATNNLVGFAVWNQISGGTNSNYFLRAAYKN